MLRISIHYIVKMGLNDRLWAETLRIGAFFVNLMLISQEFALFHKYDKKWGIFFPQRGNNILLKDGDLLKCDI